MSLATLSKSEHDEACVTYAALILHDAGIDITAEKLSEVINASGNAVDAYWCPIFAKMLSSVNVAELITATSAPGGAGGAEAAPAGDAPAAGGDAKKDDKKEKKEEKKEEEVDVGGGNLFGSDEKGDGY